VDVDVLDYDEFPIAENTGRRGGLDLAALTRVLTDLCALPNWREDNKAALRDQVQDSEPPPGVLAYLDDEPVGWCAVAPKIDYPRVVASPVTGNATDGIWSITCFVVRVGRRRGVATALLPAAVDLARSHGAATVEAYPVDASARKSISAAELYHGPLALFRDAGFTEVGRPSSARTVVQLGL